MSLWLMESGKPSLPIVARVDEWVDGDHIDVFTGYKDGEWQQGPTRYVIESRTCRFNIVVEYIEDPRARMNICECDQCGYRCARGFIVDERFKYCPNCGARIENDG